MRLIKSLMNRLSDSVLLSVPNRLMAASGLPVLRLRLVSEKSTALPQAEGTSRRLSTQPGGPPVAVDEAHRKIKGGLLYKHVRSVGDWVAELEADTTLTSEYLMLRRFMNVVDPERERKAVSYLMSVQLPAGGWPIYYGGPSDISASVKAYFALKLAGVSAGEPFMIKARECILAKGGVVAANVFTKVALALFGQYDWRGIPSMPPEIMLLPKRFYFSIYAISYWSRAVLIPLLIVRTSKGSMSCISCPNPRSTTGQWRHSRKTRPGARRETSLSIWMRC